MKFKDGTVRAPMPGKVLAVNVIQGQTVQAGAVLVILEAMKMENEIKAPIDGVVKVIGVATGDLVKQGIELAIIE